MTPSKKAIFFIQGEGRGHITQALAMQKHLKKNGFEHFYAFVGISPFRTIPAFFFQKFEGEIMQLRSPNFMRDKKNKKLRIFRSVVYNLLNIRCYIRSLKAINEQIRKEKADLILNFYEPLCGLYHVFYRSAIPCLSIAHQYYYLHQDCSLPAKGLNKNALLIFTRITALGSLLKLAIHIKAAPEDRKKGIVVIPPLIRQEVLQQKAIEGEHLLAYILNPGYAENIIEWHKENPENTLHCFWDNSDYPEEWEHSPGLIFHYLNDEKFIELMASCRALLSTAGYETVCEAMYLGKPVLMTPVGNHYEQEMNAELFSNNGAGLISHSFDVNRILPFIEKYQVNQDFKKWLDAFDTVFEDVLHRMERKGKSSRI